MRFNRMLFFVTAAFVLGALIAAGPLMSQVEQPTYTVERAEGPIEIRAYGPSIVAEVTMTGERKATIQKGFSIIAGYIFGANEASRKIEMTAPVMQEQSAGLQTNKPIESVDWTIQFVMPAKWSLDTLPKPKDPRIVLKTVPARRIAVIRFSGFARDILIRQKTDRLVAFIVKRQLVQQGTPIYAFFNPPWTLPWFRRNEIMIAVAPTH